MEYSLYINQAKATEWNLAFGEAFVLSYLVKSVSWMTESKEHPGYYWITTSKLASELPWVCAHPGSMKRHLRALEAAGLIARKQHRNRPLIRLLPKAREWNRQRHQAAAGKPRVRWGWIDGVRCDPSLSKVTRHLLLEMDGQMRRQGAERLTITFAELTSLTGLCRTSVFKHLTIAVEAGWITKRHVGRGLYWSLTEYRATWPVDRPLRIPMSPSGGANYARRSR